MKKFALICLLILGCSDVKNKKIAIAYPEMFKACQTVCTALKTDLRGVIIKESTDTGGRQDVCHLYIDCVCWDVSPQGYVKPIKVTLQDYYGASASESNWMNPEKACRDMWENP